MSKVFESKNIQNSNKICSVFSRICAFVDVSNQPSKSSWIPENNFKKWKFEFESFFKSWIESCSSHVKNQSWIITISFCLFLQGRKKQFAVLKKKELVDSEFRIGCWHVMKEIFKKYVLTKLCPWHGDFLWPHWISGGFQWHSHEYWFAALGKRVSSPQNQDLKNMFIRLISEF